MKYFYLILILLLGLSPMVLAQPEKAFELKAAFISKFISYTKFNTAPDAALNLYSSDRKLNTLIIDYLKRGKIKSKEVSSIQSDTSPTVILKDKCSRLQKEFKTYQNGQNLIIFYGSEDCLDYSHIQLFEKDGRFRFKINLKILNNDKVKIDLRLVNLASEVRK